MDVRDFFTDVVRGSTDLTDQSIQITLSDLLMASAIVGVIFLILVILIFILKAKLRRPVADPTVQLVAGLRGKLEKLEMSLNQLKTERARAKEFYKVEFEFLRRELVQLKTTVSGEEVEAPEIGAPPPSAEASSAETDIDSQIDEIDRVHEKITSQEDDLEFESSGESQNLDDLLDDDLDAAFDSSDDSDEELELPERETGPGGTTIIDSSQYADSIPAEAKDEVALSKRLEKTRKGFFGKLKEIFSSNKSLDEETAEELEALLVSCDLGVNTVGRLMDSVNASIRAKGEIEESVLLEMLADEIEEILKSDVPEESKIIAEKKPDGPLVVLVVGVNGVGKTTTVAKLASQWKSEGKKVLMVAADTFRAAAVEQLKSWGEKLDVPVVSGATDAKPGTVVFDGMKQAQEQEVDVLIVDTAGRLHNKSNLMQELEGVRNSIVRHQPTAPHETILVVDGATGQNALQQAREFNDAVALSGVIVTKLDGSPKGGIVVAIKEELGVPVRYIGVGESQEDLRPFVAADFAKALFDSNGINGSVNGTDGVSAHGKTRRRKRRETTWTM